jgi:hypothetical protein
MDSATRSGLIEQYRNGAGAIGAALEGITEAELDARPGPDEWSTREIIHHLADSEMTSAIRLRRLIVEDDPEIVGYDQEAFVRVLSFPGRPISASFAAFAASRESTAEILDQLTDEQWARAGTHSEVGRYSVEDWLSIYGPHAHDHADQIRLARASAG